MHPTALRRFDWYSRVVTEKTTNPHTRSNRIRLRVVAQPNRNAECKSFECAAHVCVYFALDWNYLYIVIAIQVKRCRFMMVVVGCERYAKRSPNAYIKYTTHEPNALHAQCGKQHTSAIFLPDGSGRWMKRNVCMCLLVSGVYRTCMRIVCTRICFGLA